MGYYQGKTEMSFASHISIRWLPQYWKVQSESGNLWVLSQLKNTVWFQPQLQVTAAIWCFSSVLLGQQTTQFSPVMVWYMKLTHRGTGNKHCPHSNRTRQISTDSRVQKTPFFPPFSLCAVFVFYSMHSRMQQPSLFSKHSVATMLLYVKLSG